MTSAVVINGVIHRSGAVVQCPAALTQDLVRHGRAEPSAEEDGPMESIIASSIDNDRVTTDPGNAPPNPDTKGTAAPRGSRRA
ncbi:hypothetical protein FUT69_00670 [Xylella taiwanensis]|uniref:Uncharacterized protein n=1 Tax=Xylella taiwanensis TaxID=1444770 RepID=Z9JKS7_9GAMM|nr:hypothetical protein [Xylella taiwanensis]AXI83136.1 hypothetical protein AB672_03840 [Xylella taiwanensis]EWS78794.1 hypothetical protein AF72_04275 [Xylella taiwanensis]MCD8456183.1 hypothetical protein [Xylella taiwanensis]MCD8458591.1 hypothetical protein [Xylella taiwanensis]MCD8460724.1 hypothetical protein [Xylella taiwanensis]